MNTLQLGNPGPVSDDRNNVISLNYYITVCLANLHTFIKAI